MAADLIEAQYEQLEAVSARFRKQADISSDLHRTIKQVEQNLRNGDWEGLGAAAFFSEMDTVVYPGLDRLHAALTSADEVTQQIISILREAEEEAAQPFGGSGGDYAGSASAGSGAAGGVPGAAGGGSAGTGSNGAPGGGGSAGSNGAPGGAGSGAVGGAKEDGSNAKLKIQFFEQDLGEKGKLEPELGFKYRIFDGEYVKAETSGETDVAGIDVSGKAGAKALTGEGALGLSVGKDGLTAGLYGEAYVAQVEASGVIGDKDFGLTGGVEAKGPGAHAMAGIYKNNLGFQVGVSAVSAEGTIGTNIAGVNVGVSGEIGVKAELGFRIGAKGVKVKLPFISLGISFGGAK